MGKLRIVHIINSFEFGGAEAMLCNLLLRTDRDRFEPSVVSLIDDLTVAGPILDAGIPLVTTSMRPSLPDPRAFARLLAHLRRARPHVVQTWMDHSNLIGGAAARIAASRAAVVWGVHHSDHVPGLTKRSTLLTVSACAALSRHIPDRVVFCSEHARSLYLRRGFDPARAIVIPNGFDTARFRPDREQRASVRAELGLDPTTRLVGLVARFDPVKDHATFLRCAARLAASRPGVHFLLCGDRVDDRNQTLVSLIAALGLAGRCHLLGPRRDVPRLVAALDVLVCSSISEAFPLAVGEAMACGVPCAVTDVGDSRLMVGYAGRVTPPSDPAALAAACEDLLSLSPERRADLGRAARERVCGLFDLTAVTRRYEALYDQLGPGQRAGPVGGEPRMPRVAIRPARPLPVRTSPRPSAIPA